MPGKKYSDTYSDKMYNELKKGLSKSAKDANKAGKIKDPFADIMLKVGKEQGVFKAHGGMIKSKYYAHGGEIMGGREMLTDKQRNLPEMLQKKIIASKKKG